MLVRLYIVRPMRKQNASMKSNFNARLLNEIIYLSMIGTTVAWLVVMVELSNGRIKIAVRPGLGGRIDDIIDIEKNKNWLWHPDGYQSLPRRLAIGENFNENWQGGWDDIFPNDASGSVFGRELSDHGELWSQSWSLVLAEQTKCVMEYSCQTVPVIARKSIKLSDAGKTFEINYAFHNLSGEFIPFLLKLHPAIRIEAGDKIMMPESYIEPVALGFSTIIGKNIKTKFPFAFAADGTPVSINNVPEKEAMKQEFVYATDLSNGWCALRNDRTKSIFRLDFDLNELPYVWIFQSFGSWRDHYVLMLEPCTTVPYDLEVAHRQGTCALLGPLESRSIAVKVSILDQNTEG